LISKNIDTSFDKAVEMVVQKIRSDFILSNNNNNNNVRSDSNTVTKAENLQNAPVTGAAKRSKKDNLSA
jgi:hypothetical protein